MRIQVYFQFKDNPEPFACTGVEDHVTDLLIPGRGDMVSHKDTSGHPFTGRVIERSFYYDIPAGLDVVGNINVTLLMDRVTLH